MSLPFTPNVDLPPDDGEDSDATTLRKFRMANQEPRIISTGPGSNFSFSDLKNKIRSKLSGNKQSPQINTPSSMNSDLAVREERNGIQNPPAKVTFEYDNSAEQRNVTPESMRYVGRSKAQSEPKATKFRNVVAESSESRSITQVKSVPPVPFKKRIIRDLQSVDRTFTSIANNTAPAFGSYGIHGGIRLLNRYGHNKSQKELKAELAVLGNRTLYTLAPRQDLLGFLARKELAHRIYAQKKLNKLEREKHYLGITNKSTLRYGYGSWGGMSQAQSFAPKTTVEIGIKGSSVKRTPHGTHYDHYSPFTKFRLNAKNPFLDSLMGRGSEK